MMLRVAHEETRKGSALLFSRHDPVGPPLSCSTVDLSDGTDGGLMDRASTKNLGITATRGSSSGRTLYRGRWISLD